MWVGVSVQSNQLQSEECLHDTVLIEASVGSSKQDGGLTNILESLDEEEEVEVVYSSSMELQSISSILQDAIHSLRSPLEDVVTTETFLDVEGKGKEIFEEEYTAFVAGVQQMETYICNYLKVKCTLKVLVQTMMNALPTKQC